MTQTLRSRVNKLEEDSGLNGPEPVTAIIFKAVAPTGDGSPPGPGRSRYAYIFGTPGRRGFEIYREESETEEEFGARVEESRLAVHGGRVPA